jgi:hypothetical protein
LEDVISSRIKEIFEHENYIFAIGDNFIMQYNKDSDKYNTYTIPMNVSNDKLELITDIFNDYIVVRVSFTEIIIIGKNLNMKQITNQNILVEYPTHSFENLDVCHVSTKDNTPYPQRQFYRRWIPLIYSYGLILLVIGNNIEFESVYY